MTPTPVGMRCPECSKQRTKVTRVRSSSASVPRVTYALIIANVAAFLAEKGQFSLAGSSVHGSVVEEGDLYRAAIYEGHQYWRLVSSAFLHVDLLHIGFNMYLLYLLGLMLEPAIGSVRFAALYLTALLAGSFGALLATAAPSLGASGAVFGLMGAAAGTLIIFNLILSFTLSNISVGAHVGGLIGGALAAAALRYGDSHRIRGIGLAACAVLSAASVAGALVASSATGPGFA